MEVTATLHRYRQSPRKVQIVANLVRNLDTKKALDKLEFTNKRSARQIRKLIQSAIANATNNFSLRADNLFIKKITVNTGPMLKRWRARAFGRAFPIHKHTSHVTVVLDEKEPVTLHRQKKVQLAGKEGQRIEQIRTAGDVKGKDVTQLHEGKTTPDEMQRKKNPIAKTKGFMPKIFRRKVG